MSPVIEGALIGERYRLIRQLAATRQSEVFVAHDERLDRPVVLKFLADSSPEADERALQEARLAAEVNHPNVVSVYDVAQTDGRRYLVLEHVSGTDLKTKIAESGPLSLPAFFRLAHDLGSALDAVHQHGILHCDIKPQNIIVDANGIAKLVDFGISRLTDTPEEVVEGTLDYLAPERLQGEPASIASDVYALGAVLYEALTGWPPYPPARSPEEAQIWRYQLPPLPSTRRPGLPAGIDAVLLRALHADPSVRQPKAGVLTAELEKIYQRHTQPTGVIAAPARKPPVRPTAIKPQQRSRVVAALLPVLLLLAAFAVAAAGLAAAANGVLPFGPTPTPTPVMVRVPSLEGQPLSLARDAAERAGFEIAQIDYQETEAQPPDEVIRQDPPAGVSVVQGTALRLTVAKLPEVAVPDLIGKSLDEAKQQLQAARLRDGDVRMEETEWAKPGTVIRQDPPARERQPIGTRVDLVVATEVKVTVPNVVGKPQAEAQKELESHRLKAGNVTQEETDQAPPGTVVWQSAPPQERLPVGSAVDLKVAVEPKVAVPNVVGKSQQDARKELESHRLKVGEVTTEPTDQAKPGIVLRQSPAPGERIAVGSGVNLVIAAEPQVKVPNVLGRSFDDARSLIEKAGLKVGEVTVRRVIAISRDVVIQQDPPPDTAVERGTKVDLLVETGILSKEPPGDGRGRGRDGD